MIAQHSYLLLLMLTRTSCYLFPPWGTGVRLRVEEAFDSNQPQRDCIVDNETMNETCIDQLTLWSFVLFMHL